MDHVFLIASTFCFLFGFAYTMVAIGRGQYHPSRLNLYAVLCGFALQTAFLYVRGQQLHRCPLTNSAEVLIFLSWSLVLFYFIVGSAYRVSLLGAFTSPLAFLFQFVALLLPASPLAKMGPTSDWLELHAALSVVAYGAFALAGIAGGMYLAQERQIKTHHLRKMFFLLPPIAELATVNRRLMFAGFALLSAGLFAGFAADVPVSSLKMVGGILIWAIYGALWICSRSSRVSPRVCAALSLAAFSIALGSLWGLNFITDKIHT